MDSWTPTQLKMMKSGGNDACNNFLHSKGVPKTASIQEKYNSDAAALYKQVLKARAEGRPEPTELVKPPPKNNSVTAAAPASSSASARSGSQDPNGMEKLAGESDAAYIARQTKLREEAKARMAAKFGNSNGGKRTMGGVGSTPHPSQGFGGGGGGGGGLGLDSFTDTLSSGFGTAASGLSSVFSMAKDTVVSTDSTKISSVAKDVGSVGMSMWSAFSNSAKEVANNLNMEGLDLGAGGNEDGLSALNERARRERNARGGSSYTGFGSDARNLNGSMLNGGGGSSSSSRPTAVSQKKAELTAPGNNHHMNLDQNSAAPLPGESDSQYMQRQMRIREEAKAHAQRTIKSAPSSANSSSSAKPKPAVSKMKADSDDDFFSSFGA